MFFKLITRNSRRSRKENGLFFASLLVSIIAFYIILALPRQDVMTFLSKMESDAVNKFLGMIPLFFRLTLLILFFLIYYAGRFQMERRRHEFGVYLMMGMRRWKLFALLLAEDFRGSLFALGIGLPSAVLLSELISLATARAVGMGIVGHRFTLSLEAVLWTVLGFLAIKLGSFLLLSGRIAGQDLGSLLSDAPDESKYQRCTIFHVISFIIGFFCLAAAYGMAIGGLSWLDPAKMGMTLLLGFSGTLLLFFGLGAAVGFLTKRTGRNRRLHIFNFRQIQENVTRRSGSLAVSSLLILAALCCFGAGVAVTGYFNGNISIFGFFGNSGSHVLDYTITPSHASAEETRELLAKKNLDDYFSELFEMKLGYIRTADDRNETFRMDSVMSALEQLEESWDRDVLLNNLQYAYYPYLISLDGYNHLLSLAGLPALELSGNEAAVYMDQESSAGGLQKLNNILADRPEVFIDQDTFHLTGTVQTLNLVTDRAIALSFALIVPDDVFQHYTQGRGTTYLNAVLNPSSQSLMNAIIDMNERLDEAGIYYESYLQNMGRNLFYSVAASYLTIYLTVIFMIIANTVIGVQFLMSQQKSARRYKTLVRLGATYEILCLSVKRQIHWYFGLPIAVAVISSFFGVRAVFTGLLGILHEGGWELMGVSAAMIFLLIVVESIYIAAVRRSASRYLLTLMTPEREE